MTQNSRSDWRASQAITQRKRDLIPTIAVDRAFLDRHNAIRSRFEMPHHPTLEYKCDFLTEPRGFLRTELDRSESRRKAGQQLPKHRFLRRDLLRIREMLKGATAAYAVMTTDHNGLSLPCPQNKNPGEPSSLPGF